MDLFNPNGNKESPYLTMAESFLGGVGRLIFPDGTVQLGNHEDYPQIVYSPRMDEAGLERFCAANIEEYRLYFENNLDAIELGNELPPINLFWE